VGERKLSKIELIEQTQDTITKIREKLRAAQDRQKSYADVRRRPLEISVGDHVFLKVSPLKGSIRFGQKGKLAPRYIGPFEILQRVDPVAYRLALPPALQGIHDVFHVSNLCRYTSDPNHVIPYEPLQLKENLTYVEEPIETVDRMDRVLRNRTIPYVKVFWKHHGSTDATWNRSTLCSRNIQSYFQVCEISRTKFLKGGENVRA